MPESTIVVGIDGSPGADHALRWGRAWAGQTGALVRAVHTWEVPAYMYSPSPLGVSTPPVEVVEDGARATLDEAMKRAEHGAGPLTAVLRHGPAVTALIDDVQEHDASLLVIGTRGLGPIRRALLGSVSSRLAAEAPCPVAVIHDESPIAATGPVVVGVDGSAGSVAALQWAATATDGPLHVVYAISYPFTPADPAVTPEFTDYGSYGKQVVEQTVAEAIGDRSDVTTAATSGDARDVLPDVADAVDASLIVLGARSEKGLAGLGSVPTTVIAHTKVPVVVVPAR